MVSVICLFIRSSFHCAGSHSGHDVFLPEEIDEGIILTDVKLTDDCFLYIAECDEDVVDIDILNAVKGELQKEIASSLQEEIANDSDIQEFVKYCKKARKGIGYKYVGTTSGKSCIVKIPYSKL